MSEPREHRDHKHHEPKHQDKHNLQDYFLNHLRQARVPTTVFLVNGVKLQGVVTRFDMFSLLLQRDGHVQLIYKHAISTIMPSGTLSLFEDDTQAADAAK